MILKFPRFSYIDLPSDLVDLLKNNFKQKRDLDQAIEKFFIRNKALFVILKDKLEVDDSEVLTPNKLIRLYGWRTVRDKICQYYLNHFEISHGLIPSENHLVSILDLEDVFFDFSVKGNSRIFLLGFYLKFLEIDYQIKTERFFNFFEVIKNSEEFLKLRGVKSFRVDWLILTVLHFLEFYEGKELNRLLSDEQIKYDHFFDGLDEKSKKTMLENLLNYGLSIEDKQTMLNEVY